MKRLGPRRKITVLAAWLLSLLSIASAVAWQEQDKSDKQRRTYQQGEIHTGYSRAFTFVGATGFGHPHGVEGRIKSGKVVLDEAEGGGEMVFDMTTFSVDTARARKYVGLGGTTGAGEQRQVTATMQGGEVLNVRRYPTARFEIESVEKLNKPSNRRLPQYRLKGQFTLHGGKQPLSLVADVEEKNGWQHLRGKFTILQTDHGIRPYRRAFGAVGVANQLTIWGDIWVAKEKMVVKE
jgi:polyisoprenoid-binding protein YceI